MNTLSTFFTWTTRLVTLKHGLHHWIVSEYELAHPVHFLCLLYSKKFNWIWVTLDSYNTWPIYEPFQHLCLLTDALSGACAGSLLEKYHMRKKKNQVRGIRSLDPYLVKLKRYHLRYLGRYRQALTSKSNNIEKNIKIEITNNSNIWKALYRKEVRQIFSVFSTCSFLILMCEIDAGCKQMLCLEHAQSDEWDSLLVNK